MEETDQELYGIEPDEEEFHSAEDHEEQIVSSTTTQGQTEVVKKIFSEIMEKIKLKFKGDKEEETK